MIYAHQLTALKRDAKARAQSTTSLSVADALNQIARENGYSTWEILLRQCESRLATPEQRAHGS